VATLRRPNGYRPGRSRTGEINQLSAESLAEVGIDISAETPKPVDPELVRDVDVVETLGRQAQVEPVDGTRFENWDTDEPSERGIDGIERMRLVRDDIAARMADLHTRLDRSALLMTSLCDGRGGVGGYPPVVCGRRNARPAPALSQPILANRGYMRSSARIAIAS
jgi:arsenate-mycothiol transferase